jgi:hypothetical protein
MSTIEAVREKRTPTPASVWQAVAGTTIGDELLEWPPDLFAATDVILERSEAYRFALSPPAGVAWPPTRIPGWADAVADVSRRWSAWVEGRVGELPDLLVQEWARFRDAAGTPLADFAEARDWGLCVALLTLHAIADEACAGLGVTVDASTATGLLYRARGRELLARTGSLTRIPSHLVRVLPKVRTPPNGTSLRSLSRYACVHRPGVEARWHKVPGREPHDRGVNYLLLPWPLRVRESDFGPLAGSVQHQGLEPFGFFEFAPSEALDLDLVDRLLVAALDEVERVDVVVLPESAVDEDEIDGLEALVGSHGVQGLIAGVRGHSEQPGQFPGTGCTSPCPPASNGRGSANTSITDGHWTKTRSTSTTWAARCTRAYAGGKQWRSRADRSNSSMSAKGEPSSPSCARTWPRSTMSPRSSGPSAR